MNQRIKAIRKTLKYTQQEFADRIRVKRNTVATYEMGRSIPSDSAISLICREFNVNEQWLRTGEGEMFNPDTGSEIDGLVRKYNLNDRDRIMIERFIELKPAEREVIIKYCEDVTVRISKLNSDTSAAQNPEQPLISGDKNIEESPGISQPGGGFSRADFDAMTPEEIADIIREQRELEKNKQVRKVVPAGTDQAVDG